MTSGSADRLLARQPVKGYQLAYKIKNRYAARLTRANGELRICRSVSIV